MVLILCVTGLVIAQELPSLDELLDLSKPGQSETDSSIELDESLQRRLEGEPAPDTLAQAIEQMRQVSVRLVSANDPGLETQRQIETLLQKRDQAIEQAKQQSSSSSSGSSGEAKKDASGQSEVAPQTDPSQAQNGGAASSNNPSTGSASPGSAREQKLDDRPLESLRQEWGDLPPRLRDELREGLAEKFSPIYQRLTEAYYRRLAEQE